MTMQVQEIPSALLKSTLQKVPKYINELLLDSLEQSGRKATRTLLGCLFKKGNNQERIYLLAQLVIRLQEKKLEGKGLKEILELFSQIIKSGDQNIVNIQDQIIESILTKISPTFDLWLNSSSLDYLSFCENMLETKGNFRPHLYEINGCKKCYGAVENKIIISSRGIDDIAMQTKYAGNKITFILKKVYQVNDFKGKVGMRENQKASMIYISTKDPSTGTFSKRRPLKSSSSINFTTDCIQLEIEGTKLGRCINCGRTQTEGVHCNGCKKNNDFSFTYRAVGGEAKKIMKELTEDNKELNLIQKRFRALYSSITNKTTIKNQIPDIIHVERIYRKVMLNLSIIKAPDSKLLEAFSYKFQTCNSCVYYQIISFLSFLDDQKLLSRIFNTNPGLALKIHDYILSLYPKMSSNSIRIKMEKIVGLIKFSVYKQGKNSQKVGLKQKNGALWNFNIFKQFFIKYKESYVAATNTLMTDYCKINTLTNLQKLTLILIQIIAKENIKLLSVSSPLSHQLVKNIAKMQPKKLKQILSSFHFDLSSILKMQISNFVILFLRHLPNQLFLNADSQDVEEALIPYLRKKKPNIPKQLSIIRSPSTIIPLNHFRNLPAILQRLSFEDRSSVLEDILKFKDFWNFNLYYVLDTYNKLLQKEDKQKKFLAYLKGLSILIDDTYFLNKIQSFLIPKRKQFIIHADIPHADIKQYIEKNREQIEYLHLSQKEIKTEMLPGDTMKEVHDWIRKQLKSEMAFQLLCEKKSINDLDVPIEMVHKKLYSKNSNVSPSGLQVIRVVYRMRGLFEGEDRQEKLGSTGDDRLEECLTFAPLLTRTLKLNDGSTFCGLDTLFKIFKNSRYRPQLQQTRQTILKIFNIVYKSESVRMKSIENNYVDILIRETLASLVSKTPQSNKQKQILLTIVSQLIDQVNQFDSQSIRKQSVGDRKESQAIMQVEDDKILETANKNVNLLLQKISESQAEYKTADTISLIKLLPFSSKDAYEISEKLFNYFTPLEIFEFYNKAKLEKLIVFMDAIPRAYSNFKNICYEKKFLPAVLDRLVTILNSNQTSEQSSIANQERLFIILKIIKASIQSCENFQKKILEMNVLPLIHRLSTVSAQASKITTLAEEILKNLTDKSLVIPQLAEAAQSIVTAYLQEKKKRALASKAARLENERKKRDLAAQNAFKDVAPVVVEGAEMYQNLKCVVCKASYESTNNVIGVYTFVSKAECLGMQRWWIDPNIKKTPGGTSVSLFTIIHFQCHRTSQIYDNQMKIPEWEGAARRNSDSKCNNWLPIKGPSTVEQEYEKSSKKYLDMMKYIPFWVTLNDLRLLFLKFGNQDNLAKDSKGSALSNLKLISVFITFVSSLFRRNPNEFKTAQEGIWYYNERPIQSPEVLSIYLVFGMFCVSNNLFNESWKKIAYNHILKVFLKHGDTFSAARPYLIILGIIKEIYKLVHAKIKNARDALSLHLSIEEYIAANLNIIDKFENIAETYKNVLLKKNSVQEFEEWIFKD